MINNLGNTVTFVGHILKIQKIQIHKNGLKTYPHESSDISYVKFNDFCFQGGKWGKLNALPDKEICI